MFTCLYPGQHNMLTWKHNLSWACTAGPAALRSRGWSDLLQANHTTWVYGAIFGARMQKVSLLWDEMFALQSCVMACSEHSRTEFTSNPPCEGVLIRFMLRYHKLVSGAERCFRKRDLFRDAEAGLQHDSHTGDDNNLSILMKFAQQQAMA